jgi:hypothetical protein
MSNPNIYDVSYSGLRYALTATGGFIMEQGIKTITMLPVNQINQYDVTNSVQIKYDVRTFNQKIGLFKDENNINIITTAFNETTYSFPINSLTISPSEFTNPLTTANIISVGKLNTLYSDFILYVNDYFAYANGFTSMFTKSSQVDANNGVFDASAFVHIINGQTLDPNTGIYVKDLSGSITVSDINDLLNSIIAANPFNNRGEDMTQRHGFVAGDLVFVPDGVTITLNLNIDNNSITWNSAGSQHVTQLNTQYDYTTGYFSSNTLTTVTNIQRVVKAPMLLVLDNLS